tara:strand:- start:508 stop:723 length:216 start_codon:yes stop_codon:yes gene_type:complete
MSNAIFSTLNKSFNDINHPFTNIILGAVLFGTVSTRVAKSTAPVLTRVKFPSIPVTTRVQPPVAPVYTRVR